MNVKRILFHYKVKKVLLQEFKETLEDNMLKDNKY